MTKNLEGRLSRADLGWLAATIFIVFVGMTFVMRPQMSASSILRLRRQR